jgi:outer membrane protein OmpA-like peptidoglycan-associated protein
VLAAASRLRVAAVLTVLMSNMSSAADETSNSPAAGAAVSFIACPVYRDTSNGRKSGCWLATDLASGLRYDVSGGRSKPQIGREVLVEGVPAAGTNVCGGSILLPVHVSVLPTACSAVMLPAEGFPGRVFQVPKNGYLPPADVIRPPPAGPYRSRDWHIEFNFQSDFLAYQYSEVILDEAARYIRASHARRVEVVGYADSKAYVVSGRTLVESSELAQARAKMVNEALRRLAVDPAILYVKWHDDPAPTEADDGLAEPSKRRVTIHVEM